MLPLLTSCGIDSHAGGKGNTSASNRPYARYVGSLPCNDCRGIRWDLLLYGPDDRAEPQRYSLLRTRIGPDAQSTTELGGTWSTRPTPSLGPGMSVYRLEPPSGDRALTLLRVDESRLRLLDEQGNVHGEAEALQRVEYLRAGDAVDVAATDARAPVQLGVGQSLRVHLSDSPATGYRWDLKSAATSALRIESDPGAEPVGPGSVTAGTLRTWTFRAQQPGAAQLRFDYHRSWETSASPQQSVLFDISIR